MSRLLKWTLLVSLFAACGALAAQTLEVTKSPVSVDTEYLQSGTAFDHALVALRFEATGGDVDLNGFALAPDGATFDTDVTDLACWLDDGDGVFDDQADTLLSSGPPVLPKTTATFTPSLTITSGTFEDIWIVASFGPDAGSSLGKTYSVAIADAADVDGGGAGAVIGSPSPQSSLVKLVYFEVEYLSRIGNIGLELWGSGFTPPYELTIGGITASYPAPPQGAGKFTWSPWGPAVQGPFVIPGYFSPAYVLLEDHSKIRFYFIEHNGEWKRIQDFFPDEAVVSVELKTASSGPHDLGTTIVKHSEPALGGSSDGDDSTCTTAEDTTALPFGLALIVLALAAKAFVVATHLRSR